MLTRHSTDFPKGYNVVPHVRVAAGNVTLLELAYEWDGVGGVVPLVTMSLDSDASDEKVFLAGVYQNGAGERRVFTDSRKVRPGQAAAEGSADAVLYAEGWTRCFLLFQTFVPPGLMGPVEEENSVTQVFEFTSGVSNV